MRFGGFGFNRLFGFAPAKPARVQGAGLAAQLIGLVLTRTSSAGASPLTWDTAIDGTVYAGYFAQLQVATDSGFSSVTQDLTHILTADDLARTDLNVTSWGFTTPSGLYFLRMRVYYETDDGLGNITSHYSAWSNVLTDTISAAPGTWATTTGANKSQYLPAPSGMAVTGPGGGFNNAPCSVRALPARTGKRQWQITLTSWSTNFGWIGMDDGTDTFADQGTTNFSRPGKDNSTGVSLSISTFAANSTIYAGGVAVQSGIGPTIAAGDIITLEYDDAAGTVSFYNTHSGVTTQIGTTVSGLSFSNWYPDVGLEDGSVFTSLFGSGQARTLSSGYSYYDS